MLSRTTTLDQKLAGIPPWLDLEAEITRLRTERKAVILAHYYQEAEIQDLADFLGDSLALAQAARDTDAEVILFAGVHFMAETAKILNPERTVIVPDMDAGCSLADACPADQLAAWKAEHPDHLVVAYINCSAGTKALAANDGLVIYAHNDITGYGNMVTVAHLDGSVTMYAHLQAAYVFPGMQVRRAQVLGEIGETGIAHGTHLHFEWRIDGVPANPLPRFTRVPARAERRLRQLESGG